MLISKDAHRTPFHGQRQIGLAIPVQVREGRSAHQAKRCERLAQRRARRNSPLSFNQTDDDTVRISAGEKTSANKQVQVAVAVNIGHAHGTNARFPAGQRWGAARFVRLKTAIFAFLISTHLVVRNGDE